MGILGGQTIHLTSDVDTEQAFFFTVLLPHGAQTGEVGGHRLNAPDDGGHFDLFAQCFEGVISPRYRCSQITKLPRAQIDFATGVGTEIGVFAAGGLHGIGALAIEDARLTTTRVNHFHELMDERLLGQATHRPDGRVIGIPAVAVFVFEITTLGLEHFGIFGVKQRDHGSTAYPTRHGGSTDHTHHVVGVNWSQKRTLT